MADSASMADLRAEDVQRVVTGFALQEYRFKSVVMIKKGSAWSEVYYQETAADLTGGTGANVKGIPRFANFPYGEVTWTKQSGVTLKHGMEGVIAMEDAMLNNVDVIARTLLRIGRAVAKSVDDEIWDVISESQSATNINSVSIAAGSEWDSATIANRDPIQNILDSIKAIQENNYDPLNGNGFLLVNPKDFANLLGNANVRNAGQFYTDGVTRNGRVGKILGLNIIVSNSVTADYALVCVGQECGTWVEAMPLTVKTIETPGQDWTIRAWELGQAQLTNPKAITLIDNTAA